MPSEQDPPFVDIFPPARSFASAVWTSRVRWAPLCLADQESGRSSLSGGQLFCTYIREAVKTT